MSFQSKVVVVALLATTNYGAAANETPDDWMETDFVAQHALWTQSPQYDPARSVWLAANPLAGSPYLFGDPAAPRVQLPSPEIDNIDDARPIHL